MEFLSGWLTTLIVLPIGLIIGAIGGLLVFRFRNKMPNKVSLIIDRIFGV